MCPVWGLCECGNGLHRSIKDTVTRPGMVFHAMRHDVLTQVLMQITPCRLTGYGRFGGTQCLHLGTVEPEEGKLAGQQGATSQMTWIFTNTAVGISQSPTVVSKRRQKNHQSTLRKIPKDRRSHIHRVRSLKSRHCGSVNVFRYISMPRQCTRWGWQGVFFVLFTSMPVISDTRKLSHNW